MSVTDQATSCIQRLRVGRCLTTRLGQVPAKLVPVLIVDDVVHAGVDQLLLLVLQVLRHVVRHEHDAALSVDHKQKPVQRLRTATTRTFILNDRNLF